MYIHICVYIYIYTCYMLYVYVYMYGRLRDWQATVRMIHSIWPISVLRFWISEIITIIIIIIRIHRPIMLLQVLLLLRLL